MVSLLSRPTFVHTPAHPLLFRPHIPDHGQPSRFKWARTRRTHFPNASISRDSNLQDPQDRQTQQLRTLFPGGYKRPEIKVPNVVLRLNPDEVLSGGGAVLNVIDEAVSKWVGIVVLSGGEGAGGRLYEAACLLKSVIRERAYLMIAERVDIAAAVKASGVVLSDQGLPALVARNTMLDSKPESVVLPLVAMDVRTANSALNASKSKGVDFLIYDIDEKHAEVLVNSVFENVKIPVFIMNALCGEGTSFTWISNLINSGASGLVIALEDLGLLSDSVLSTLFCIVPAMDKRMGDAFQSSNRPKILEADNGFHGNSGVAGFIRMQDREKQLIERERLVLLEAINVIQEAAPMMGEVSLLIDAVFQLDEPFLLAIVGEFNSGKSTVINAILGKRYLKEGVVPTTNEITFLRHAEFDSEEQQRCERHPDGQYICYLSAPILKEMNIVDTPGTNVILQRQQRLTEEFVPRADLLLFVISADRPLTESEVAFLRYTQQWKKKLVFVLNKSDLYRNASELEEGISFIKENAQKLLNTDFLDGSTSTGIERIRLKLETPIGIADQLLLSCETIVRQECRYAKQDLVSVNEIVGSIKEFAMKMQSESISWRRQTLLLIDATKARVVKLIESTLQLSNIDLAASYVFKGDKSSRMPATLSIQNDIIGPALTDARRLLGEYVSWLQSHSAREKRLYEESFEKRWPSFVYPHNQGHLGTCDIRNNELSLKVIENFSVSAASKLFEQEIREAFLGTFGGLGVAGLSASLLTSVLPTTLEDLLALGLCSAGGLLAVSNFPARRQEMVNKVRRTSDALAHELEEAMQKDLLEIIENLESFVKLTGKPYEDAAQDRLDKLSEIQYELSNVDKKLRTLQIEIQNLHVS
ncbi:probable transmembrane GTPase FZO-like, chloroplastic isoform X2 [Malania oleifera]|uniref:probable transmembrane GTPase FZO-like, chloroplastic isoform X2 n=1 Tax=Malania oleifera TaxID=397392 RepID=UPI0025AE041B|nr:probable transmembrane GTPase FZO-like, chloroplastic isoform X2 [Malania oleifera]